jgi:uncharacterized surface protein with fasciclin (FAS1) repeats
MQMRLTQKIPILLLFTSLIILGFTSCKDEYIYDNKEPDFLGASIYDYLEQDGSFTYFLRLINDLNYREVLSRTGSKTLFPARDDAFERFFRNNIFGTQSYNDLSHAQKRIILNAGMVNMAYLSYMLSNVTRNSETPGAGEGLAIRRMASNTYLDSISFIRDEGLFAANAYWESFKTKGLYLIDNDQAPRIVHFTPANRFINGITAEDFAILNNGLTFSDNDIFINGIKIIQEDIICKNGYIHVMEDVLTPNKNMAQIIRDNGETDLFNHLMNKFALPYYSEGRSQEAHSYYDGSAPARPLIPQSDSIFIKRYMNDIDFTQDAEGNTLSNYGLLYFDPTDYAYSGGSEQDMGAMFVPSDQALNDYFNGDKGRYLKDVYGTWDNVPTTLLALFLKNHQKKSFITSLPHFWENLTDESSFKMNVSPGDIRKTYLGGNGAVYVTNTVFPPVDYQSVYASTMTAPNTKIMNWAIQERDEMKFYLYLRSMENMYNLIVPVDEAFDNYRDPISWASKIGAAREIWSFRYVPETNQVYADVYGSDEYGNKGAFLRELNASHQAIIRDRLFDIIDMHIVVGYKDKTSGAMTGYIDDGHTQYAQTKSGATLKITGGSDYMQMTGGGDMELNLPPAEIVVNQASGLKSNYPSENGKTYFIDRILQDPVKSVYTVMGEHSEFTAFFNLLKGDDRVYEYFSNAKDEDIIPIFDSKRMSSTSGLGYVVNSFNNFRYTVFVPTEAALNRAFAADDRLFTWDEIAAEEDYDLKKAKTLYLLEFLKYHFMDNSIYVDGRAFSGEKYETAARNSSNKFRKLTLSSAGNNLEIQGENVARVSQVMLSSGLYNLMSRDYIVNSASYMNATQIEASSRAVIHLIDEALKYEENNEEF